MPQRQEPTICGAPGHPLRLMADAVACVPPQPDPTDTNATIVRRWLQEADGRSAIQGRQE